MTKNLDFMSGVVALLGAVAVVLLARWLPEVSAELIGMAGTLALFGGGALLRWFRRPTDGDPDSTVTLTKQLDQLGLPKLLGDTRPDLERRAQEGWVAITEFEPEDGEAVLGIVGDQVVVGAWGSAELEGATHWRGQPAIPPKPESTVATLTK